MLNTAELARFACTWYARPDFPDGVCDKSKARVLDGIACVYSGMAQPAGVLSRKFLERGRGQGSTLVAGGLQTAPEYAAWAHGIMMHAIDWDDWTFTLVHPTASVFPAVLAVAEQQRLSVRCMLNAFIVAVETMLRIARAVNPELYMRGWHPSSTISAIGSAVGAGLLLGHNEKQLCHDVSLALCQAAGMFGNKGTMGKPFQVGNSNRAGVMSALAVSDGFEGTEDILDTKFGFTDTFLSGLDTRAPGWRADNWEILREWPVKPYPVGGSRQSLIEATLGAARKAGRPSSADIAQINCIVNKTVAHVDHRNPGSWLDSRFSHAYCTAVTAIDGVAGPEQFEERRFAVGDVQALMTRVNVVTDEEMPTDPTNGFPTRIEIVLRDGRRVTEHCGPAVGENAGVEDGCRKIDLAVRGSGSRGRSLLGKLENECTVQELVAAMVVDRGSSL